MKPPPRIKVGARVYTVTLDGARVGEHGAHGLCVPEQEQIFLDPAMSAGTLRETLVHEIIHAVVHDVSASGAAPVFDDDLEERVCSVLAPRLLDTLRRNPRLATYITAP